jgi:hypothetical protein
MREIFSPLGEQVDCAGIFSSQGGLGVGVFDAW